MLSKFRYRILNIEQWRKVLRNWWEKVLPIIRLRPYYDPKITVIMSILFGKSSKGIDPFIFRDELEVDLMAPLVSIVIHEMETIIAVLNEEYQKVIPNLTIKLTLEKTDLESLKYIEERCRLLELIYFPLLWVLICQASEGAVGKNSDAMVLGHFGPRFFGICASLLETIYHCLQTEASMMRIESYAMGHGLLRLLEQGIQLKMWDDYNLLFGIINLGLELEPIVYKHKCFPESQDCSDCISKKLFNINAQRIHSFLFKFEEKDDTIIFHPTFSEMQLKKCLQNIQYMLYCRMIDGSRNNEDFSCLLKYPAKIHLRQSLLNPVAAAHAHQRKWSEFKQIYNEHNEIFPSIEIAFIALISLTFSEDEPKLQKLLGGFIHIYWNHPLYVGRGKQMMIDVLNTKTPKSSDDIVNRLRSITKVHWILISEFFSHHHPYMKLERFQLCHAFSQQHHDTIGSTEQLNEELNEVSNDEYNSEEDVTEIPKKSLKKESVSTNSSTSKQSTKKQSTIEFYYNQVFSSPESGV